MKNILERIKAGEILVCDGAMGTQLQARGLKPGECPELWCIEHAEDLKAIHTSYKNAGSDIVECNSFGGTSFKLEHYGLEDRVSEINKAAAMVAKEVAGTEQFVLGSVGPTGEFLEPYGDTEEDEMKEAFATQIQALEQGGADAVIIETMTALEEAELAVKAAKENTDLVVIASFTFDPQVDGSYATMMGVRPAQMATRLIEAGADIVGTNCGVGSEHMIKVVEELRSANAEIPIMVMPNAGMPVIENGEAVFKETPSEMAAKVKLLIKAGASIIGGCCGTSPEHIKAMKDSLR